MTYFHYYATTSRNLDRVMQYTVFPLTYALGLVLFRKNTSNSDSLVMAADKFARVSSFLVYSSLTSAFFGFESEMIDANARKAVSAEMGVDEKSVKFSDYGQSKNIIMHKAYDDILKIQKYRYGTDALFMLPMALQGVSKVAGVQWKPHSRDVRRDPLDHTNAQIWFNGHTAWDFSVLAGKAAYWAGETYLIEKTGHYEVVKLIENLESTGKDMSVNDLLGVYQRTRTDRKLEMIERPEEYDALRPLLRKMADAYNKHDKKFDIPEIVYLMGLNKINIHAADNKTFSPEAVEHSHQELDRVLSIGLDGIREENRKLHSTQVATTTGRKTLRDTVADTAFGVAQTFMGAIRRGSARRPEEYITVRDPGELTNWHYSINR